MKTARMRDNGISLRTIHACLVIGAVLICGLVVVSTFHLSASFNNLAKASEQHISLRNAARELTDTSDYLTEKVQRFTVQGDRRFMDEYFAEALEANHREEALSKMSEENVSAAAREKLQNAMDSSVALMNREYRAMKLVVEAKGYDNYPEALQSVELSEADRALTPEKKMALAARMVHDDDYYDQKDHIRESMRASLNELEQMIYDTDASAINSLGDELTFMRIVILLQTAGIILLVWLTWRLGLRPILNAVKHIKEDGPIPEVGANEFRYLALTYNKMFDAYKRNLEHLNYKASHDELTGAYNRTGYDLLLSGVDLSSTYMLLFDVDDFKDINDELGHDAGDKALVKIVKTLKHNFGTDDYVCRIGGDEFVVLMVHSTETQSDMIARKIEAINEELTRADDGLPPLSVSVGIAHGSGATDIDDLFEKADAAMYQSKRHGKNTCTFYAE